MGLFDNSVEVVINNKIVQSIKTKDGGVLYEKSSGTSLTIDVPLNLVYSDSFYISGALKDSNQTGLVGETVKLKVGNTIVDSTTTTTGGAYSFTHTPVATGNHSFQVVYEGSLNYDASVSSIVTRTIGKETSVLTVTSPTNNYLTYNANITFTGTLTDDDGTPLAGKTIIVEDNGVQVTTITTGSNGAFSKSVTLSEGSYDLDISYAGDSNYSASSVVNRTVIVREHDYAISISADKPILSYSDEDSCTVTALLTDNSVLVSGETLSYVVKHDSTVIDSGSDVTDSNGQISFSYTATGIGDVDVIVSYGTSLQEIFVVEDCWKYDPTTHTTPDETINFSIGSPNKCKVEFDFTKGASGSGAIVRLGDNTSNCFQVGLVGSGTYGFSLLHNGSIVTTQTSSSLPNGTFHCEFIYDNGSVTCKINNQTKTYTYTQPLTKIVQYAPWSNGSIKNIKVKAL